MLGRFRGPWLRWELLSLLGQPGGTGQRSLPWGWGHLWHLPEAQTPGESSEEERTKRVTRCDKSGHLHRREKGEGQRWSPMLMDQRVGRWREGEQPNQEPWGAGRAGGQRGPLNFTLL